MKKSMVRTSIIILIIITITLTLIATKKDLYFFVKNVQQNKNLIDSNFKTDLFTWTKYPVKHVQDISFEHNYFRIFGFTSSGRYLIISEENGLIVYDLEMKKLNTTSVKIQGRQIVNDSIYGIDDDNNLVKLNLESLEKSLFTKEKVYSYIVSNEGVSYQIFNEKDSKSYLSFKSLQIELPKLGIDYSSKQPRRVHWSYNGKYALYFEDVKGEDYEQVPVLYLVDVNDHKIKEIDKTFSFNTKWSFDSKLFVAAKFLGSITIYNPETKKIEHSLPGVYTDFIWGKNQIFGIRKEPNMEKLIRYDLKSKSETTIYESKFGISSLRFIEEKDLLIVRIYSENTLLLMQTNGEIGAELKNSEWNQQSGWAIDEKGNFAISFKKGEKYFVSIYKLSY